MKPNALIQQTSTGRSLAVLPTARVIQLRARDPWKEASARARQIALWREIIVLAILNRPEQYASLSAAIDNLVERARAAHLLPPHLAQALRGAAKAGRAAPDRRSIFRWVGLYQEGGVNALLPEHKGRVAEIASWWGPALEYYNQPSKPTKAGVHHRLTEDDGFAVTYDQVRAYLSGVPAQYGRCSPARLGKNMYRLHERKFVRRCTANALPGDVYVADGYRGDIYLAHPITGDIWRPEFTCAIDLRSRYPVGWRADEHEGTYAVQNMWAETFSRWNHVPPMLYVDNGSGYKNKLMDEPGVGFYDRAGVIQVIHSLPGNPHGKGWVEQFFRIVKDDFIRLYFPQFFCGHDAAPENLKAVVAETKKANRRAVLGHKAPNMLRIMEEVQAKRMTLPTLDQFTVAFNQWIEYYVNRAHPEDKSVTRADIWRELAPIPPAMSVTELKRRAVKLIVHRASVRHGSREYGHSDLHAYNHKVVVLEYDLTDNTVAVIRDESGRWICDAALIKSKYAVETTILDETRAQRAANAVKRLDIKRQEQLDRAGNVFDAGLLADSLADVVLPSSNFSLVPSSFVNDDDDKLFDL